EYKGDDGISERSHAPQDGPTAGSGRRTEGLGSRHPPLIYALHPTSSPANISRLIIAVTIDAIKRMSWRGFAANVCQKILKAVSPSIANGYSAAAIISVSLCFYIVISLGHSR